MSALPVAPFDPSRYIGTVCQVTATAVHVNLPRSVSASANHHAGYTLEGGQVGEFVVVETDAHAILARIYEVRLPERDRLKVEPDAPEQDEEPQPIGIAQLLTAIELSSAKVIRGIPVHPRIGQYVYSAHPLLIKHAIEPDSDARNKVRLAYVPHSTNTMVSFAPEALFGRHCAVLGATGGGKSWTVARLIEEIVRLGGKAVLFDATGEFRSLSHRTRHVYLGGQRANPADLREFVSFPYQQLTELDLFAMFQPSGASQAPKLREALRSLKLLRALPLVPGGRNGPLIKAGVPRQPIEQGLVQFAQQIIAPGADYDVSLLPAQVFEECVWATDNRNPANFGGYNQSEQSYVATLMSRLTLAINSTYLACIFQPAGLTSLPDVLTAFLASRDHSVLRVSMENLPFEHNARELVTNAIGRHLLIKARTGMFKDMPTVAVLDEAHQFLNKSLGDEFNRVALESFGIIAKEGRKYGLTCVLATQRPRDIPDDVLSQMGMFVVHRLINDADRKVVERACGNMDSNAASFLPTLSEGEAIVVGVESPMPLPVRVVPPTARPESKGPDYAGAWRPA